MSQPDWGVSFLFFLRFFLEGGSGRSGGGGSSALLLLNIKRNQLRLRGGSRAGGIVGASRVGFELIFFFWAVWPLARAPLRHLPSQQRALTA